MRVPMVGFPEPEPSPCGIQDSVLRREKAGERTRVSVPRSGVSQEEGGSGGPPASQE